ncbi:MAG TPA: ATP-dependent DNA ligase [Terriglobales bacterium]|nr:ATP-dependent DNA ligase [Terriglobales bacterium]
MYLLAPACEAIAHTTKKLEKTKIVAGYLRSRSADEAAISTVFLSGRPFPAYNETTLGVGRKQLWRAVQELSGKSEAAMTAAYRRHGDLGAATYDVFSTSAQQPTSHSLNVVQVEQAFRQIAATRGAASKFKLVYDLLAQATPLEAKYLVKIMTGELRIGMRESLVEEGIAKAYGREASAVQRANMMLGDIGETCRLAIDDCLGEAHMRLFHPIGFMLASPVQSAEEAFTFFQHAQVEDKYDGIRAQAHCRDGEARLFSRTLDDVTESFPELGAALAEFFGELILDGEIVAWNRAADESMESHALPFSELQKRLGRKTVTETMMRNVPVAYVAFDVLYVEGELVVDWPLRQRASLLDGVFSRTRRPAVMRTANPQGRLTFEPAVEAASPTPAEVIRAPVLRADSAEHLEELFAAAQARGNEGLMIKDLESPYTPGRRGQSWVKLKRELATLDVVVTSVEYGHGKRVGVLSDYTFAVRDGDRLVNIGKAYSGLTDKEMAGMTEWFLAHTLADHGFWREVEPRIVLEVAFNAIMRSDRHASGYALRFPRILRIRDDKPPQEADAIERVRDIYARQHGRQNESGLDSQEPAKK